MPVVLKELPLVIAYKLMLVVNSCNPQNGLLKNINKCYIYCYIYIYRERERERENVIMTKRKCVDKTKLS